MADINIAVETSIRGTTGLVPTFTALSTGNTYKVSNADGRTTLIFKNADAGIRLVTFTPGVAAADGLTISDLVLSIAAGDEVVWGPAPKTPYNDITNDRFDLAVDGANVTMAAVQVDS